MRRPTPADADLCFTEVTVEEDESDEGGADEEAGAWPLSVGLEEPACCPAAAVVRLKPRPSAKMNIRLNPAGLDCLMCARKSNGKRDLVKGL
jgi:hypothetical protein